MSKRSVAMAARRGLIESEEPWTARALDGGAIDATEKSGQEFCSVYAGETPVAMTLWWADAKFIAEAGNVARETGLTPKRLYRDRLNLLGAARLAIDTLNNLTTDQFKNGGDRVARECLAAAIAKAEAK